MICDVTTQSPPRQPVESVGSVNQDPHRARGDPLMISGSTLSTALIGIFTAIATVAATIAISVWKWTPPESFGNNLQLVIERREAEFERKLTQFAESILESGSTDVDGEPSVTDGDIQTIRDASEAVDRARALPDETHSLFKTSYQRFAWAAIDAFSIALTLVVFHVKTLSFTLWPPDSWDAILILLGIHLAFSVYTAIVYFNAANSNVHEVSSEAMSHEISKLDGDDG